GKLPTPSLSCLKTGPSKNGIVKMRFFSRGQRLLGILDALRFFALQVLAAEGIDLRQQFAAAEEELHLLRNDPRLLTQRRIIHVFIGLVGGLCPVIVSDDLL